MNPLTHLLLSVLIDRYLYGCVIIDDATVATDTDVTDSGATTHAPTATTSIIAPITNPTVMAPSFESFRRHIVASIDLETFQLEEFIKWIKYDAQGLSFDNDPNGDEAQKYLSNDAMKHIAVRVTNPFDGNRKLAVSACVDEFSRLDAVSTWQAQPAPSYLVRSRIYNAVDSHELGFDCLGATLADPRLPQPPQYTTASDLPCQN